MAKLRMDDKMGITTLVNNLFSYIENKSVSKSYSIKLILFISLLSLILATPAYHYMHIAFQDSNWQAVMLKSINLLDPLNEIAPGSHGSKKVFRLTVPFLIKIFSLVPVAVYVLQVLIGIFNLYLIYKIVLKTSSDAVISTLVSFGIGFLYFGRAGFVDIYSWFDAWAYFFLLLAMLSRFPILVSLFSFFAAWTDERAVIMLPVVLLFHQIRMVEKFNYDKLINYIKLNSSSLAVAASIFIYAIIRLGLEIFYQMRTPDANANFMRIFQHTDFWGFGVWSFFEGFWVFIIFTLIIMYYNKNYLILLLTLIPILVFSIIANIVNDITRSGSYVVPLLFVMIVYLIKAQERSTVRIVLLVSAVITFLFPAYYIITDVRPYILWYKPIFIRFIDYIAQNLIN